jgi:hypothetical protein
MPASFWPQIDVLQGHTLHTVARSKPFTVTRVTNGEVEVRVHDGGKTRILYRKDLEPFWQKLVKTGVVSVADLKTVYQFNSSLAAALLAACNGVTATTNPITLRYPQPSRPTKHA